jgi:queuosine precursor transporter
MVQTTQPNGSRHYRYLGVITVLYVTMQLVCDATAGKLITLGGFAVSVTVLYFPLTYIFSDVLTEVYGYARARAVLWTVMFASILAGLTYQVAVYAPPAPGFDANEAYRRVFGIVPRVLVGAWLAIFAGDIANNYVMAKLKIFSRGKYLWFRIISSTVVGQFVNTLVFYVIGLYRIIPANLLFEAVLAGWLLKTGVEVVFTPVTYYVVGWLKRAENEDYYDHDTNFNPLIVSPPF